MRYPLPGRGDLVYHLLYGRSWNGLLLEVIKDLESLGPTKNEIGLVHMVPGTEYQHWFRQQLTRYRITSRKGYLSYHWLRKLT